MTGSHRRKDKEKCLEPGNNNNPDSSKHTIVNAVLSLMHGLSIQNDKSIISEAIVSRFDLSALKKAREVLFKTVDPVEKFTAYNGPQRGSDRDKVMGAFDSVYTRMMKLDADDQMPIFLCPSEDLPTMLTHSAANHTACNITFSILDAGINSIKSTVQSISHLMKNQLVQQ